MRTFWDGIDSDAPFIPTTADGVMGYVPPSSFAWTPASWARFPHSVLVRITPSASVFGPGIHMLDVEAGDASPGQAPDWATSSRRAGQDPTVYCNSSTWADVQAAFNAAHVAHPNYVIAHYDGNPNSMPTLNGITAVGKQYLSTQRYDLTAVPGYWPGVDPAPTSPGDDMGIQTFSYDPPAPNADGTPGTARHVYGTETSTVSEVIGTSWICVKFGWADPAKTRRVHLMAIGDAPAGSATAQYLADQVFDNVAGDAQRPEITAPEGTTQYSVEVTADCPYAVTIITKGK